MNILVYTSRHVLITDYLLVIAMNKIRIMGIIIDNNTLSGVANGLPRDFSYTN